MKPRVRQLAKLLNKLAREIRLEQEAQFGRQVSKKWDGKKSKRQQRREFRQLADNMKGHPEKLQERLD